MATFDPPETKAEAGTLRNASEELISLGGQIAGTGGDVHAGISGGAAQFSELVSPSIQDKGAEAIAACQTAVGDCHYGASVCGALADDVSDFRNKIASLQAQWDDAGSSSALHLSPDELREQKNALARQLNSEARKAYEELEDDASDKGGMMSEGATASNVRSLVGGGHMSWFAAFNLWGAEAAGEPSDKVVKQAAEQSAGLLSGGPDGDYSQQEVESANALMKAFEGNSLFATTLMNELGSENLFIVADRNAMWLGSDDNTKNDAVAREMYENLGLALALATNPDSEHHVTQGWVDQLMENGATQYSGKYGYQSMAPLLQYGEYHPDFLVPVTEHMMAMDRDRADWDAAPGNPLFDGDPIQYNPVNAALIALNNNPEAATELFANDHPNRTYPGIDGATSTTAPDPLEHMLGRSSDDGVLDGHHAIDSTLAGNALVAATTGVSMHSADALGVMEFPEHTAEMAKIAEHAVDFVGDHTDLYQGEKAPAKGLVKSFGVVSTQYMAEIYGAYLPEEYRGEDWVPKSHGVAAQLGGRSLDQWLEVIGTDNDATMLVTGASMAMTEAGVGQAVNEGVESLGNDPTGAESSLAGNALVPQAKIFAKLGNGQLELDEAARVQNAEDHNDKLKLGATVTKTVYGQTLGKFDIPVLQPNSYVSGKVIDGVFDSFKVDPSAGIEAQQEEMLENSYAVVDDLTDEVLDDALRDSGLSQEQIEAWKRDSKSRLTDSFDAESEPFEDKDGNEAGE